MYGLSKIFLCESYTSTGRIIVGEEGYLPELSGPFQCIFIGSLIQLDKI